jgi:CRISPR-associated endonuclease/helicase Cas3
MAEYYGHTLPGFGPEKWESLENHLDLVHHYLSSFASKFKAEEFGQLLAYWHDLGKYDSRFQDYLKTSNGYEANLEDKKGAHTTKVNHSSFGAQYAVDKVPAMGQLLAYAIAGHHAGLPDYSDSNPDKKRASSLEIRLSDSSTRIDTKDIPDQILNLTTAKPPALQLQTLHKNRGSFQCAFWLRMMFSCLVDADFLATEEFMSPDRKDQRKPVVVDGKLLLDHLLKKLEAMQSHSKIGLLRQRILEANLNAAQLAPGLFSLTVPTGGGKTLSSLAFALKHLVCHRMERIIYAIPFTSIVEQTAAVFSQVFQELGDQVVLEHHSNLDPEHEEYASRLAAENWDAPLIVTTNVQLLESLFAAKPSRCRKLHRIAKSVIILDEAQTLPVEYLEPCLAVLQELALNYGCTIVLCTATQPAIELRDAFPIGLDGVKEIIPDPQHLSREMKRVDIQYLGQVTQSEIVLRMSDEPSFLCIVNTRPDAAKLYQLLKSNSAVEGFYHLSTNMCAVHRFEKLAEIRQRLHDKLPTRVVSTQLIEAGVDVDFPVVFRALAGLDSIAQAAGRCNREGRLPTAKTYVFDPCGEGWSKPMGYLKRTAEVTRGLINDHGSPLHTAGWLSLEALQSYFRQNYWTHSDMWDKQGILKEFQFSSKGIPLFQFREVASKFRLIEDLATPVFIPYDERSRRALDELRKGLRTVNTAIVRRALRILQRYSVGLNEKTLRAMLGKDVLALRDANEDATEYYELINVSCYDEEMGLDVQRLGILGESLTII